MKYYFSTDEVFIADGAKVCGDVSLSDGVSIWFNAVIRGDEGPIIIGNNTNIQDCAVVHGKTVIGNNCTVGHAAIVHACTVGNCCIIGMGSIILDGAVIEDNCIVGAGAVVTGKTYAPAGSLLIGNPAKIARQLTPDNIEGIKHNADNYVNLTKLYR